MDEDRQRGFDRGVLLSLLGSGALWIAGFSVWLGNAHLGAFAALYVLVGSLALATRRLPTGRTLVAAWVGAMLLVGAVAAPSGSWVVLPVGVVLGSVLFLAWSWPDTSSWVRSRAGRPWTSRPPTGRGDDRLPWCARLGFTVTAGQV